MMVKRRICIHLCLLDNQDYKIVVNACDPLNKKQYIIFSRIVGTNALEVKKLLDNLPTELYVGKAPEVKEVANSLNEIGISYHIVPEFKY